MARTGIAPGTDGRILVTGAGGFVGRHFVRALIAEGYGPDEIVATSHAGDAASPALPRTAPLDLEDPASIEAAVATADAAAIVHLAAVAGPADAARDAARAGRVNVDGAKRLARAALERRPDARILFIGSSEAYGESFVGADAPLSEDTPLRPRTPYGRTKAEADAFFAGLSEEGADVVRFRPFNHTGAGQSAAYVAPAFASQIARIEAGQQPPVLRTGALDAEREMLDVRDVVRAYVAALRAPKARLRSPVYNLSSGAPLPVRALLDGLLALTTARIAVETDPARLRPSDVPRASGDASRAARDLHWRPEIPLTETMSTVLEDWRARVRDGSAG